MFRQPRAISIQLALLVLLITTLMVMLGEHFKIPILLSRSQLSNVLSLPAYFESMLIVDPSFNGPVNFDRSADLLASDIVCTQPLRLREPKIDLPEHYPAILHEYATFHRQGRECLHALANHKSLPNGADREFCERPKLLMYYNLGQLSGLGDSGRGMMMSLLFAIATRRLFFIPGLAGSTSDFPLTAAFIPSTFDWRVSPSVLHYCLQKRQQNSMFVKISRRKNLSFTYDASSSEKSYSVDSGVIDKEARQPFHELFGASDVVHLFPRMPSRSMGILARMLDTGRVGDYGGLLSAANLDVMLMHMLFKASAVVDRLATQLAFPHDPNPYASVHVRTGLDMGEVIDRRFGESADHLDRIARGALQCVRNMSELKNVFVASDSLELKRVMIDIASEAQIHVATALEKAVHTSTRIRDLRTKDSEQLARLEQCRGYMAAAVDVVGLSRGKVLIAAPSTFAGFAFQLGNIDNHSVFQIRDTEQSSSVSCNVRRIEQ